MLNFIVHAHTEARTFTHRLTFSKEGQRFDRDEEDSERRLYIRYFVNTQAQSLQIYMLFKQFYSNKLPASSASAWKSCSFLPRRLLILGLF